MAVDWEELHYQLRKRSNHNCEWCGKTGSQAHHCLIHRKKGHPELDCLENLMLACSVCHVEKKLLDTDAVKQWFWLLQVERYGLPRMLAWLDRVNEGLIVPYRFPD